MNKKTINYLIIVIIIIFLIGVSYLYYKGILGKLVNLFSGWKTYNDDISGLVFDYPLNSSVEEIREMGMGRELLITVPKGENKKVLIFIKSFSNPFPEYAEFDIGEAPESYYFSLPGKFDGEKSPVYTYINDDCAYNKKNCDEINKYMNLLPQKRYEIVNNKNQKVKVVRYVARLASLSDESFIVGNESIMGVSFNERYILDFGFKTVWVRIDDPLIEPQGISSDRLDEYTDEAAKQINSDQNLKKKLSSYDEFIRRISVKENNS